MACRNPALSRLKLNREQPTAHVALLAAHGKNGPHGPRPVESECARVILKVIFTVCAHDLVSLCN